MVSLAGAIQASRTEQVDSSFYRCPAAPTGSSVLVVCVVDGCQERPFWNDATFQADNDEVILLVDKGTCA